MFLGAESYFDKMKYMLAKEKRELRQLGRNPRPNISLSLKYAGMGTKMFLKFSALFYF